MSPRCASGMAIPTRSTLWVFPSASHFPAVESAVQPCVSGQCRRLPRVASFAGSTTFPRFPAGGYIGCWLSAILRGLGRTLPAGEAIGAVEELIAPSEIRKKDEEPAEIAFLRAYSNYLTPRLGLFSSDTLAALTGYLRNLFLSLLLAVFSVGSLLTSQVAAECSLSRPAASHFGLAAGVDRSSVTEFSRSIRAHSAHRCRSPCRSRDHS